MRIVYYIAIATVLLMRLNLALTRAFDPDEFAHLHWTWLILHGHLPYRDFFYYILPGFQWILSPILWSTGDSTNFLIASRVFMLIVYGLCALLVYRLSRGSLLATLIFLAFPVTIDKTIDVRPDMVMLVLYFASVLMKNSLISGILFGVSVLMFPKIVFALPALFYIRSHPTLRNFLAGALLVGFGFLVYLWFNNLIPAAYTSVTRDSVAVTSGKVSFSPLLLFTPYPLIYVAKGGVSLPWLVNTVIWITGLAGLVMLHKTNQRMAMFWTLFIGGNVFFVILFPAPYVQYFLPLSVAASVLLGNAMRKNITIINFIIVITIIASFFLQYRQRSAPGAGNGEQLGVIRDVLAISKPTDTFYDMVGSYVFRRSGYFICCHPYAEFADKLTSPPPALAESLVAQKTKLLVMDRVGFVFWQTPEPAKSFLLTNYLSTNYNKIYSLGQKFRCQNGACVQYSLNDQPAAHRSTNVFSILVPEAYTVAVQPPDATITFDDQAVQNGQAMDLAAGIHRFSASATTTTLRIQLSR